MKCLFTRHLASFSAAILIFASTSAVFAQNASDDDKHFVEAALKGGMAEVELGKLASQKGASSDVKQFGQKMVVDHTMMGDQMKAVAEKIGVTPPSMDTPSDMALKAKLEVLTGAAFDKAYISAMVKGHEDDLADFRKEIANGTSPAVKSVTSQGESLVERHLAMIRKIAQAHNVSASFRKPSPSTLASVTGSR
jgi:putative membrane protein